MEDSNLVKLETDVSPESEPVSQPRTTERHVEHYQKSENYALDVKIKQSELFSLEYKTSHPSLGKALVINNVKFQPQALQDRSSSDADAANIFQRLQSLGFDVDLMNDVPFVEILRKFAELADIDHSNSDCFFCVIMSHGDEDGIWATDKKIDLKTILKLINATNCPTLLGKPKVFFIQCCRGTNTDNGCAVKIEKDETVSDALGDSTEYDQRQEDIIVVPNDMDFLISYSSVQGKSSFRDTEMGTPFINVLCKKLDEVMTKGEEEDIYTLLLKVNEEVAEKFQAWDGSRQMPTFTSTLRKRFKLRKKTTS